jgi:hypothetical protein
MMSRALKIVSELETDHLVLVMIEFAKREQTEERQVCMDAISLTLSKRLKYDDFRAVMVCVNETLDA